eukprot:CAMPEP_0180108712 /NCGR_PEP_ID=MMETSP0985-20121206/34035_1 /TAXON_ID=483367 /ORGANISM="non described non described, Strain CCMP 2436" /LENGTH=167 /DNA_ID=CAMNT_0022046447 /DNA_START=198 /DNA_END=703 /DNA_ORIENTATION=-
MGKREPTGNLPSLACRGFSRRPAPRLDSDDEAGKEAGAATGGGHRRLLQSLKHDRSGAAAAVANGRNPVSPVGVLERGEQRDDDPHTGRAHRMPHRHRASEDVHLQRVQAEDFVVGHGDDGEGLVTSNTSTFFFLGLRAPLAMGARGAGAHRCTGASPVAAGHTTRS